MCSLNAVNGVENERGEAYKSGDVGAGQEIGLEHGGALDEVEKEKEDSADVVAFLHTLTNFIEKLWKGHERNAFVP